MFKNFNFKDFISTKTPLVGKNWLKLSDKERVEVLNIELKKNNLEDFEVFKTPDNGQIVFKVSNPIPSGKRGLLLLDLESNLKENIDEGLTVWFEPVGDKSKLRNMRGITFQSE
tara:strand:- start:883 stop:1224 length:342 start_codon:yes stop_codon:yes gene_type:complete